MKTLATQTTIRYSMMAFNEKNNCSKKVNRVFQTFFLISLYFFMYFSVCYATPESVGVDYDIVYVRYPAVDPGDNFVTIPQGEHPYSIASGADLMLLHPDGSEDVLVDCITCSVMDPVISLDGRYVYYSKIEDGKSTGATWIYKINLSVGAPYTPIRLTFDDGFESLRYAGNTTPQQDQGSVFAIKDMAPFPLSGGKIVFTSNRAGLTAFDPDTNATRAGSIQQLYVMDDHDGSATTAAKANLHRIETGSLHMVQHPIQLLDGRILFSTWQDVGNRFRYAMTSLFTVHPDGSNMQQFTEPHDHHKNVEHFITQLPDEQVVSGWYYPSFDYGFGALLRYPIADASGIDFLRKSVLDTYPGTDVRISYREFDRKGTTLFTPHTRPGDSPAPNRSGKYSMPSATVNGDLLVAYSTGYVNHFHARCSPDKCEALKSGIYIIRSAATSIVDDHNDETKLVMVKNDPEFNEIWPRAVVPYHAIYGEEQPNILPSLTKGVADNRLTNGEAAAIVGTSSMYNRDSSDRTSFQSSSSREIHDGNWTIQGAEAGIFTNDDIYAVRIIATPPKPFTKPISKWGARSDWDKIRRYLNDHRLDDVVARYGSLHNERWEILGEFPFSHKAKTDGQGNPDTSWASKVPADTPFLIQTLDKNGMTIISELTWRALKAGEKRTDCGGCHAHAVEPLEFSTTQAGQEAAISGIMGVDDTDTRIKNGMWDLTSGSTPLLSSSGVEFLDDYSLDVEFNRDVLPILNGRCVTCHTDGETNGGLVLNGVEPNDAWGVLTNKMNERTGSLYTLPQRSKYIRIPQARESLLVWVAWGERLDGRTNADRTNDIDYPNGHPSLSLTDLEKRTIARWVDLGSPIDFPQTDGFGYTNDNQLPIVTVFSPKRGPSSSADGWVVGVYDSKSGINFSSVKVIYTPISESGLAGTPVTINVDARQIDSKGILTLAAPTNAPSYIFEVSVKDNAGNINIDSRLVKPSPPSPPTIISVE